MKTIVSLVLASMFVVSAASAAKKAPKPVTCLNWKEVSVKLEGDLVPAPVAICVDSDKPVVLRTYSVVEILDEGGVKIQALIGWR